MLFQENVSLVISTNWPNFIVWLPFFFFLIYWAICTLQLFLSKIVRSKNLKLTYLSKLAVSANVFKVSVYTFTACVRYLLSNSHFSLNDSPPKTKNCFLFHLKSYFHSQDIHFFFIFIFPSFFPYQPLL